MWMSQGTNNQVNVASIVLCFFYLRDAIDGIFDSLFGSMATTRKIIEKLSYF